MGSLALSCDRELFAFRSVRHEMRTKRSLRTRPAGMSRRTGRHIQLKKAREAKLNQFRTRSASKGSSRAGEFEGAASASFLQPLDPGLSIGRLSPPPIHFDPSPLPRKRKRRAALPLLPDPPPKSDLSPSRLSPSPSTGLIAISWLKLAKMRLMNSFKRLHRRRRGRPTARRFSSPRRPRRSLR